MSDDDRKSLVTSLNGSFDLDELKRLKFPVAWCGTVPAEEQEEQETALRALADEAIEQLQAAYDARDGDDDEFEIVIVGGVITDIIPAR